MKKRILSIVMTLVMCLGLSISVSAANVKIDTGKTLTVKAGKTYQFKLTANSKPTFVSGNSKVFSVAYKGHTGKDYFYQVKAVGKVGQVAGFYLNGSKTPVTVATVASQAQVINTYVGSDGKIYDSNGKLHNQSQTMGGGAYVVNGVVHNDDGSIVPNCHVDQDGCIVRGSDGAIIGGDKLGPSPDDGTVGD